MDERQLIRELAHLGWKGSRDVLVGPGDDGAVLRGGLVVSTDLSVEEVHFRLDWISPSEAGFRAGAAALSDMAAMGARPIALLVSLAVPEATASALEFQRGVAAAGDRVAVSIIGGDVSRSPGPVVLDVVAVGRAKGPVLRGGAEAGDELWVSGALGGAAGAVAAWLAGDEPGPQERSAFVHPPDRTALGVSLAESDCVRAMIDLSDGLVTDCSHLAGQSGLQAVLDPGSVPIPDGLARGLNLALEGGEDYELLFASQPGSEAVFRQLSKASGVPLTRIGVLQAGDGVLFRQADGQNVPAEGGFDHFAHPP
ncbi:MAG: thiamine-phosphate kinase [Longimicrobiales bacterium]